MGKQQKFKKLRKEEELRKKAAKIKLKKKLIFFGLGFLILFSLTMGGYFMYQKFNNGETNYKTGEKQYSNYPDMVIDINKSYFANLKTSKGDIKIKLDAKETPKTVNNFVFLSRDKFYDGLSFHRAVKDFMIQGGDKNGDGTGNPGYKFDDEPINKEYKRGVIAMANSGENTNGSQFFIMHKDNLTLPKNYVIFGEVIEGIETVDQIANTEVESNSGGEMSKPKEKIEIKSVTIEEK